MELTTPFDKLQAARLEAKSKNLCSWCQTRPAVHKVQKTWSGHTFSYISCEECRPRFEMVKP